ncbi:filamentous hemagglutinin N-terminal domain-containing protein [Nostoc sp. LEGE 12447]|uniref:two-partner secretion domain-containing protein n=1 Tax=Nostoc sp. LEGE 12447 TaxID=1828640 RepID=UPI00188331B8|nr:filamentous hemagglutinin N-terminal domain-containing protein [Nostoc sp. LEGE 12447]MBE9002072.1 filamentous hemagglutinin N-terminal domain-containing protein [Nostoc sp. LEGE 12447]
MKTKLRYYQNWESLLFGSGAITVTGCWAITTFAMINPVRAQIVPDNTLEVNSSVAPRCTACTIEGGTVRGTNLFHSFSEFSVLTGGEAFFNNATSIQNIFTRITGTSISNIDGLMRANGTANLFFINPNGIIFGKNARLDIGGSFVASTASSILFADGTVFNTKPDTFTTPLLTVSVPIGLQFNGTAGDIVVQAGNQPPALENQFTEVGDAGQLLDTAQSVNSPNSGATYNAISGNLDNENDVDLYQLFLPGGQAFTASTVGGTDVDTQLFLFDSNGLGLFTNDDSVGRQSTIPLQPFSFTPGISGIYYLGISSYDNKPRSSQGNIFPAWTELIAPGRGLPLRGWDANSGTDNGTYTIAFNPQPYSSIPLSQSLQVQPGRTLALLGGNVRLEGGKLQAPGGRVELAGVAGLGVVGLTQQGQELRLSVPQGLLKADVSLTDNSSVNVSAGGGGSIAINAQNINLLQGSILSGGINSGLGSVGTQAGDITFNATKAIAIISSNIATTVQALAVGNAGNIAMKADSISIAGRGSNIFSYTSPANQPVVGNAGDITMTANSISMDDAAYINSSTYGQGNAGDVTLTVRDRLSLAGADPDGSYGSSILSKADGSAVGDAGNITITAGSMTMNDGALLGSSVTGIGGEGNSGNITLTVTDGLSLATGNASFGSIISNFLGGLSKGSVGDITITASSITLDDSIIDNRTTGIGHGGNVNLTARSIALNNGSSIESSTYGDGNAGKLNLTVTDTLSLAGRDRYGKASSIEATVNEGAEGNGGKIAIKADSLSLMDGAQLASDSQGLGVAGDIEVQARSITLDTAAQINAETASGRGGNIILSNLDLLMLRKGSFISTTAGTFQGDDLNLSDLDLLLRPRNFISTTPSTAQFGGDGGNITIDADFIVAVPKENSDIRANAFSDRGGNIRITSQGLFGIEPRSKNTQLSDITASSQLGVDGLVQLNTPDVKPSQGLTALPTNVIDTSQLIANSCIARSKRPKGKFIITGNGGLPVMPDDPAVASYQTYQIPTVTSASISTPQENTATNNKHELLTPTPLIEAQGWMYGAKGEIILTASALTVAPGGSWPQIPTCSGS